MMKKLALFLICFFPLALLFCVFTLRFRADGGVYLTFLVHTPVIIAGDGSNYQSAYQFRHGQAAAVRATEIDTIRDRYWVADGRSSEDFYHKGYDTLTFTNASENGHAYDIITFGLPTGTNAVYFDVTAYRMSK